MKTTLCAAGGTPAALVAGCAPRYGTDVPFGGDRHTKIDESHCRTWHTNAVVAMFNDPASPGTSSTRAAMPSGD